MQQRPPRPLSIFSGLIFNWLNYVRHAMMLIKIDVGKDPESKEIKNIKAFCHQTAVQLNMSLSVSSVRMPKRNKTPIREGSKFRSMNACVVWAIISKWCSVFGRLMTIIGSLTAEECLVEGFASSMMGNEDRMNVGRDLLMRQCTPVTYNQVVTHNIESIGVQQHDISIIVADVKMSRTRPW
jgi:hypothetical protein